MPDAQEIIETGVEEIGIDIGANRVYTYKPSGQRVKWFRDELGQLWCKWSNDEYRNHDTAIIDRVVPASRVVMVTYYKRSERPQ